MKRWFLTIFLAACSDDPAPTFDAAPPPDASPPDAGPPDADTRPACDNQVDDDGDTKLDYPFDPGCDDSFDGDEADPDPLPDCADELDNDGDGYVDFGEDPGCTSAADVDEWHGPPVGCGPSIAIEYLELPATWSGELAAGPNELVSAACEGYGSELAFQFFVPETGTVVITESGTADVVLYVRELCQAPKTELACTDDPETLTLDGALPGGYFLIVDGFGPGSLGTIELALTVE